MEDSRGVKRAECECSHCLTFDWSSSSKTSLCNYCGCPPTKHRRIYDDENVFDERNMDNSVNFDDGENAVDDGFMQMKVVESNGTFVLEYDDTPLENQPSLDPKIINHGDKISGKATSSKKVVKIKKRSTQPMKKSNTMEGVISFIFTAFQN